MRRVFFSLSKCWNYTFLPETYLKPQLLLSIRFIYQEEENYFFKPLKLAQDSGKTSSLPPTLHNYGDILKIWVKS